MNSIKKIFIFVFIIIVLISSYFILKIHYENHRYDMNQIASRQTYDYSSILRGVFEKKDWSELQLSENFKNKYKTKYDITENAGKFVSYDNGSTYENGEELLIISYDKIPIFDFDGTKSITTWFYFKYKVNDEKLLDDVELVRTEKTDTLTGKNIIK